MVVRYDPAIKTVVVRLLGGVVWCFSRELAGELGGREVKLALGSCYVAVM